MRKLFLIFFYFIIINVSFAQNIDNSILDEIKSKALKSHSDAVIISRDNNIIYKDFFGKDEKPIYIASAGKSLTSLAIGKLLDNGQLDSLDQPVYSLFPEWKQGHKKEITIKMLLNHTSGLQNNPNASIELEPAPDYKIKNIINLALAAELSDKPGTKVNYNNKAVALLGGIIEKASGVRMDVFFENEFYKPMNITDFDWIKDQSGNPTAHGAFLLKPSDFIKFGLLVLNKGVYNKKRIVSESWINNSLKQSQDFTPVWGLLWWRLPEFEKRIIDEEVINSWKKANVDKKFINSALPLKGKLFENKYDFFKH